MVGSLKGAVIAIGLVVLAAGSGFAQGLAGPPPAGSKVVAMFTGLRATSAVAVAVHCTNFDKKGTTMTVEFFSFDTTVAGSGSLDLASGETKTFVTGAVAFYNADLIVSLSSNLDEGSARILSDETTKLICTADMLSTLGFPPAFFHRVPTFDKNGK